MPDFYDELAPFYHLIFADWDATIERQGRALGALMREQWPGHRSVLDVSCGIGTQAIALAQNGFWVKVSDNSRGAIERARSEAVAMLLDAQKLDWFLALQRTLVVIGTYAVRWR